MRAGLSRPMHAIGEAREILGEGAGLGRGRRIAMPMIAMQRDTYVRALLASVRIQHLAANLAYGES